MTNLNPDFPEGRAEGPPTITELSEMITELNEMITELNEME